MIADNSKINGEPPAELQTRATGSTTLDQCGWCRYASGTHRFNYCIRGNCLLSVAYDKPVTWDTDCRLKTMGKRDIQALADWHKTEIDRLFAQARRHTDYLQVLSQLKLLAPDIPPLPRNRRPDHFNIGDSVAVYADGKWRFGIVENGYRHHDGFVTFKCRDWGPQDTDPDFKGYSGAGTHSSGILLHAEYLFFASNPEAYSKWCAGVNDPSTLADTPPSIEEADIDHTDDE